MSNVTVTGRPSETHTIVGVTHGGGGVAEVQIYLHGDELNVVVSTARGLETAVTVNDVDVYPSVR